MNGLIISLVLYVIVVVLLIRFGKISKECDEEICEMTGKQYKNTEDK